MEPEETSTERTMRLMREEWQRDALRRVIEKFQAYTLHREECRLVHQVAEELGVTL